MSTFVELTEEEMDDLHTLLRSKSHSWRYSGRPDSEAYANHYESLAEKFKRPEMDDR